MPDFNVYCKAYGSIRPIGNKSNPHPHGTIYNLSEVLSPIQFCSAPETVSVNSVSVACRVARNGDQVRKMGLHSFCIKTEWKNKGNYFGLSSVILIFVHLFSSLC